MKFFLIFTIKHFRNLFFVFGTFRNSLGNSGKTTKIEKKNVFNKNNKKLTEVDLVREGGERCWERWQLDCVYSQQQSDV